MKVFSVVVTACLCMVLGACATMNPETTKASDEWRLKSLEESFLNFREAQRREKDEGAEAQALAQARMNALEHRLAKLEEQVSKAERPLPMDRDLPPENQWKQGGEPMAQSPEEKPWDKVPPQPEPMVATPEPAPAPKPEPKMAAKPAPKPAPKPATGMKQVGPQTMYSKGMALYNSGDYPAARTVFTNFIDKYPKSSLAPNALYWKGETYYSEDDFAQAILAFREVTSKFPKHDKASSALLKLGMSYERLGDKENARFYLKALTEDFPSSAAAGLARPILDRLGS